MPIEVTCDECFHTFSVRDEHAGRRGKCPVCEATVQVPRAASATAPARTSRSPRRSPTASRGGQSAGGNKSALIAACAGAGVLLVALVGFVAFKFGQSGNEVGNVPVNTDPMIAAAPGTEPAAPPLPPMSAPPIPASGSPVAPLQPLATIPGSPGASSPGLQPVEGAVAAAPEESARPAVPKRELADLIEDIERSVVRVDVTSKKGNSTGSGFVIDTEGTVVTNYHVVAEATSISVYFSDKSTAKVLGYVKLEPEKDIALLKIDYPADKLVPVRLAQELPRKGESVVAFGSPLGLSFTASEGIVSSIRSEEELNRDLRANVKGTFVQTTTPISPGNSGGPLVNMNGEVVGANTMTLTIGQNLNFAISARDLQEAVAGKQQTLIALAPESTPTRANERPSVSDASGTERGRKLLAELQEVAVLKGVFTVDPTGRAYNLAVTELRTTLDRVKIRMVPRPGPKTGVMVLAMGFGDTGEGTPGTRSLFLTAVVTVLDESEGKREVVTIWNETQNVGSFSLQSLARGVIPRTARGKIGDFFDRFRADYNRAVAESSGEPKPETETEKQADK